ncbi:MAG: hypothetical protein LBS00_11735, partial [Synergistaceae bacterium]|nr:hypothetical protein [Synergistaceae bacterium]
LMPVGGKTYFQSADNKTRHSGEEGLYVLANNSLGSAVCGQSENFLNLLIINPWLCRGLWF